MALRVMGEDVVRDVPRFVRSETAMAPRLGSTGEDDGYLVTITIDVNADRSDCVVFDAARLADGPVATVRLPERVSSGTHSFWAAGAAIPGW